MAPNTKDFESKLCELLKDAKSRRLKYLDIRSGYLYRMVGEWSDNRMPCCCGAMYNVLKRLGGKVLRTPPSGFGARLVIRYRLE